MVAVIQVSQTNYEGLTYWEFLVYPIDNRQPDLDYVQLYFIENSCFLNKKMWHVSQ